jgi:hypothetical protein
MERRRALLIAIAVPKMILEEERVAAFDASVDFIRGVHRKYEWYYQI